MAVINSIVNSWVWSDECNTNKMTQGEVILFVIIQLNISIMSLLSSDGSEAAKHLWLDTCGHTVRVKILVNHQTSIPSLTNHTCSRTAPGITHSLLSAHARVSRLRNSKWSLGAVESQYGGNILGNIYPTTVPTPNKSSHSCDKSHNIISGRNGVNTF